MVSASGTAAAGGCRGNHLPERELLRRRAGETLGCDARVLAHGIAGGEGSAGTPGPIVRAHKRPVRGRVCWERGRYRPCRLPSGPCAATTTRRRRGHAQLLLGHRTNVELYPQFQENLRQSQVPVLAIWGKNDKSFVPGGAEAFKRDVQNVEVHLVDAGYFALTGMAEAFASVIVPFLDAHIAR